MTELWSCRIDGTRMREIGEAPESKLNPWGDLQWRPDCKALSFVSGGVVRVVAAP
jgi:hypothetical protein